jgi:hypothetical protein
MILGNSEICLTESPTILVAIQTYQKYVYQFWNFEKINV